MNLLRDRLREVAQQAETGDHPSEAVLLDFLGGLLPDEEMRSIREHLTWCEICNQTLERLDVDPGFEIDPSYNEAPIPVIEAAPVVPFRVPRVLIGILSAAAGFVLALILFQPWQVGGSSLDALLSATDRGVRSLTPVSSDTAMVLRLTIPEGATGPFRVHVEDVRGKRIVGERTDLEANTLGRLNLSVPLPPAGDYRVVVTDREDKEFHYPFTIEAP